MMLSPFYSCPSPPPHIFEPLGIFWYQDSFERSLSAANLFIMNVQCVKGSSGRLNFPAIFSLVGWRMMYHGTQLQASLVSWMSSRRRRRKDEETMTTSHITGYFQRASCIVVDVDVVEYISMFSISSFSTILIRCRKRRRRRRKSK